MMGTMGRVYRSLELFAQAQPMLERMIAIVRSDPRQTATMLRRERS